MDAVHDDPSSIAALLRTRYKRRLPSSLNELTGPEHGLVELPLHIADGMRDDQRHYQRRWVLRR